MRICFNVLFIVHLNIKNWILNNSELNVSMVCVWWLWSRSTYCTCQMLSIKDMFIQLRLWAGAIPSLLKTIKYHLTIISFHSEYMNENLNKMSPFVSHRRNESNTCLFNCSYICCLFPYFSLSERHSILFFFHSDSGKH